MSQRPIRFHIILSSVKQYIHFLESFRFASLQLDSKSTRCPVASFTAPPTPHTHSLRFIMDSPLNLQIWSSKLPSRTTGPLCPGFSPWAQGKWQMTGCIEGREPWSDLLEGMLASMVEDQHTNLATTIYQLYDLTEMTGPLSLKYVGENTYLFSSI